MRTLAVLVAVVASLPAADPQLVVVEKSGDAFVVPVTTTEYQQVAKQVAVQVNGRAEIRTVTELVPVTTMKHVVIDAKSGDYQDRAGRPLDPAAVTQLLKHGVVLALSVDGTPVGPDVLKKNEKIQAILLLKAGKPEKGPAPKMGVIGKGRDGSLRIVLTADTWHPLVGAEATDLGGNPMDVKTLRVGNRVAVSADHQPVDPRHLPELKGVVAVIVPQMVLP
jgi:hypothetical protein